MTIKRFIVNGFALIIISLITFAPPVKALNILNQNNNRIYFEPLLSELKYEAKEKTSLDNPVVDPNFNVMRKTDMNKPLAVILVAGILILAVAAPLVAWKYFTK